MINKLDSWNFETYRGGRYGDEPCIRLTEGNLQTIVDKLNEVIERVNAIPQISVTAPDLNKMGE